MYDYVIVGSGFFGATFARLATDDGKKCLVIDKRKHTGGNAHSYRQNGIDIHAYGPHIFHTNSEKIWNFVNRFASFNNFILSPKAFVNDRMYSLPFNMNTFHELWRVNTPAEAKHIIEKQKFKGVPQNLEEQALSLVGRDIYELLIRDYTKKQWKKDPKDLPAFIIKRLPVRFTYDNNYFNDKYQGIPDNGYDGLFNKMFEGIEVKTNVEYFEQRQYFDSISKKIVFTGKIDEYFNYDYGDLEYRGLSFIKEWIDTDNYQGAAIVNYSSLDVPWTRIIEHKHFNPVVSPFTVITKEYPINNVDRGSIPYYPINDERNQSIFKKYEDRSKSVHNVIFGGRLSEYRYYDMHQVIGSAMSKYKEL